MKIFKLLIILILVLAITGCVQKTVVEVSNQPKVESNDLENQIETSPSLEEEALQEIQFVNLNNSKEFKSLIKLYNKTVNRKPFVSLSYTYFNTKIGRKGVLTHIFDDKVRLDLFKESTYYADTNLEIVTFKLGDTQGLAYCKNTKRCSDVEKEVPVNVEDYPFSYPFDTTQFRDGIVHSSQYIKNVLQYNVEATYIPDSKRYVLLIDGANGFVIRSDNQGFVQEWDELEVNRVKEVDVNV